MDKMVGFTILEMVKAHDRFKRVLEKSLLPMMELLS
jgi:hypothetical protein